MKSVLSLLLLLLAAVAQALSAQGVRVLSIWDDIEDQKLYSKFIGDIESRGFKVSHATPKQEDLSLTHLGARVFDHLMIFPTKAKGLGPNLTAKLLLDFMKLGGNILLALSADQHVPTAINSLLLELDIQLPADRTGLVVDHFNYDVATAGDLHDVVLLPPPGEYRPDAKDFFSSGDDNDRIAVPRAVGHVLGQGPMLTPVLRAPRTGYLYNPKEQAESVDDVFAAGAQLGLVSVMQARNSARLALVGSAAMLQDKWFDAEVQRPGDKKAVRSWNKMFARRLAGWTFHEIGHLRVNGIEHRPADDSSANATNPKMYRVEQNVTYTISISEWVWDMWWSYMVPDEDELQLEFSRLSPFQRVPLWPRRRMSTETEGVYQATFQIPDQHGIFNFVVNYKRPFLTNIEEKNTVSVRHKAHDEYDPSTRISSTWPYRATLFALVVGWLAFLALWMFNKPAKQVGAAKKTQ